MPSIIITLFLLWALAAHFAFFSVHRRLQETRFALRQAERNLKRHKRVGAAYRARCAELRQENDELIEAAYAAAHRRQKLESAVRGRLVVTAQQPIGWTTLWEN